MALTIDAHPSEAIKLAGTAFWRVRVGDLRLVYLVLDAETVVVLRVARRAESTYRKR